jgi:hypothetical protein
MAVRVGSAVSGHFPLGNDHLYMTQSQRWNAPAAVTAQIGAFPTVNSAAGD